jgi:trimethylamine--corrinoid protein Co-methyltransferase
VASDPHRRPGVHVLTDRQRRDVHAASLGLLESAGVRVPVQEVRALLEGHGARVAGEQVYLPPGLVESCLERVRPITLYDQRGNPALPLAEGRVTFGALADTFYFFDLASGKPRPFVLEDQGRIARLLDALPGIDWIQCVGQSHDVPESLQTQMAVLETVRRSSKPILAYPYDRQGVLDLADLSRIVAGGEAGRRERPWLFVASVPAAPLNASRYNLEILIACAERSIPVLYYDCPAIGGNAPCSVAGTLVMANADWLFGLTVHQLWAPGAPFVSAGFTVQVMDMRTTQWAYCAPESQWAYAAGADLAHGYGMPAFGIEMIADSPRLDAQAGQEMAANCLWACLTGAELVHNAGMIGAGKLVCPEALVLADEIIGATRAAVRAPDLSSGALAAAAEILRAAGPGAEYVSHPHTLEHFRDLWYPSVFDRSNFDPLAEIPTARLTDRLTGRAAQLQATHQGNGMPREVETELEALERAWRRRAGA